MVKAQDILGNAESHIALPSGVKGRKGSIAATIANIEIFQAALEENFNPVIDPQFASTIADQRDLLEVLYGVGWMDLFSIGEWLQDDKKLGRIFFTLLYLESYPALASPLPIQHRLEELRSFEVDAITTLVDRILG